MNSYREMENEIIPLKDGRNLSTKLWFPDNMEDEAFPAILEYLPYRKRDGTAPRDDSNYPVFAEAGYVGVRVDISGTGESDGDYDDEYSPRELSDGVEVIEWIASQTWCSGSVGMMGISWGGFNSLQIAALRPQVLKAVIAIGTTVDRYNDDIHYKHGCHLYSNFSWSSTMLCFASRPPDPLLVGDNWKKMWKYRLETQPFPLETWLAHQRRDDYWKHGSIGEDFDAIQIPAMVISGWADAYINAPPTMAENGLALVKAINGPWIHKYPHFAWPKPRLDFHTEAIKWWDHWLKGIDQDIESLPAYRAYISENVKPGGFREFESGHWVGEDNWPTDNVKTRSFYLHQNGLLSEDTPNNIQVSICSPQDCGVACGEVFSLKPDSELAGDQRVDDAGSLVFETEVLDEPLSILGRPTMALNLAIDRPIGNVAVRLIDVHPNGASHRISWGVLNLAHRDSNEFPMNTQPNEATDVVVLLDHCGYKFLAGHRIRVSISTAYWPMIMPPPEVVTASINLGESCFISLPVLLKDHAITIPEPTGPCPLPAYACHQEPSHRRTVERDLQNNLTHYKVFDDTGEHEEPRHGMRTRHTHDECWSISPNDPLSSTASSTYISYMSRGDWKIKTVSESSLSCDAEQFMLNATITAYEGDLIFNQRNWSKTIKRDFT